MYHDDLLEGTTQWPSIGKRSAILFYAELNQFICKELIVMSPGVRNHYIFNLQRLNVPRFIEDKLPFPFDSMNPEGVKGTGARHNLLPSRHTCHTAV